MERIDKENHFFLTASLNIFINIRLTEAFEAFTGIKEGFLGNEGVSKKDGIRIINDFIKNQDIDNEKSLIIGHGLNQDIIVLEKFGCKLDSISTYDTLDNAKVLLGRSKSMKLSDLLLDAGYLQGVAHDAYQDARNLIPIYSYLKRIEKQRG